MNAGAKISNHFRYVSVISSTLASAPRICASQPEQNTPDKYCGTYYGSIYRIGINPVNLPLPALAFTYGKLCGASHAKHKTCAVNEIVDRNGKV